VLELGKADARPRRGIDAEPGGIERGALVPSARIGGETLVDHERPIEPPGRTRAENIREHFQRLGVGARDCERGREIAAVEGRLRDPCVRERDLPAPDRLPLLPPPPRADLPTPP